MIGMWIKANRKHKGLTVEGLAEVLEVDSHTVKNWESGRRTPRGINLAKINELFGVMPE